MTKQRYLIVNADDFGQSAGINRGIIDAHEHGVVTSASLMVRWPAAIEAARYARSHTSLSLGLHFDFGEWCCRDGYWSMLYEVVPENDVKAVKDEARRQRELRVPLRSYAHGIRYHGGFYGQDETGTSQPECIRVDGLIRTLEELLPGFTELGCHPGYAADLDSMYCAERAIELEALCDPRTRTALAANRIALRSFGDLAWSENGGL